MTFHVPAVFRYPEAIAFWIIYIWVFSAEGKLIRASMPDAQSPQDRGTMRLVLVLNQAAMLLAFGFAFFPWLPFPHPRVAVVAGTAILLAGGLARRACFRALGRYFTGVVMVGEGQPVIDRGPYRFVRHPSYTAGVVLFAGIGVALGTWPGLAALLVLSAIAYSRRVKAEEAALLETIGEPYRLYMARTKRFVPFVI